jgi:hypothetical protein
MVDRTIPGGLALSVPTAIKRYTMGQKAKRKTEDYNAI